MRSSGLLNRTIWKIRIRFSKRQIEALKSFRISVSRNRNQPPFLHPRLSCYNNSAAWRVAPLQTADANAPLLDLTSLDRWYGTFHALKARDPAFAARGIGLLGPNGAGKSSLLKILLGLLPPSSGTGHFLGHELGRDGVRLRQAVGYMPEADALIPGPPRRRVRRPGRRALRHAAD